MLHAFYNPLDWDSCLAAWATRHALGDAVEFHTGEVTHHENMLLLNRREGVEYYDEPAIGVLTITTAELNKTTARIFVGNLKATHIHKHQPCCLSTWQNFHVSDPPKFFTFLDHRYGTPLDEAPSFNALLGIPWDLPSLDQFIYAYEDPRKRSTLLADGQAILKYRQLRGDLCPR